MPVILAMDRMRAKPGLVRRKAQIETAEPTMRLAAGLDKLPQVVLEDDIDAVMA